VWVSAQLETAKGKILREERGSRSSARAPNQHGSARRAVRGQTLRRVRGGPTVEGGVPCSKAKGNGRPSKTKGSSLRRVMAAMCLGTK